MEQIQERSAVELPTAVGRMAGHAVLTTEQIIPVSQHIRLSIYGVTCTGVMPEDHALFLALPFDEGRYSVQLIYLKQQDNGSDATVFALSFHPDFFRNGRVI